MGKVASAIDVRREQTDQTDLLRRREHSSVQYQLRCSRASVKMDVAKGKINLISYTETVIELLSVISQQ
jgi:hypothetical protein